MHQIHPDDALGYGESYAAGTRNLLPEPQYPDSPLTAGAVVRPMPSSSSRGPRLRQRNNVAWGEMHCPYPLRTVSALPRSGALCSIDILAARGLDVLPGIRGHLETLRVLASGTEC